MVHFTQAQHLTASSPFLPCRVCMVHVTKGQHLTGGGSNSSSPAAALDLVHISGAQPHDIFVLNFGLWCVPRLQLQLLLLQFAYMCRTLGLGIGCYCGATNKLSRHS